MQGLIKETQWHNKEVTAGKRKCQHDIKETEPGT